MATGFLSRLEHERWQIRSRAVDDLAELLLEHSVLPDSDVRQKLLATVGDENPIVHEKIAHALVSIVAAHPQFADLQIVQALIAGLDDDIETVRSASSTGLVTIMQARPDLTTDDVIAAFVQEGHFELAYELAQTGPLFLDQALRSIQMVLEHEPSSTMLREAFEMLIIVGVSGQTTPSFILDTVSTYLSDENSAVRKLATEAYVALLQASTARVDSQADSAAVGAIAR